MQGAEKIRRAAYVLYVSKKFFPQRSITSHLVAALWQLSGMAITNDLPSVFCWVSQMASSPISNSISWDEMWISRGSLMFVPKAVHRSASHCGNFGDALHPGHPQNRATRCTLL